MDVPVGQFAGVSFRRDRRWGLLGGMLGALVGGGSLAVAVVVDGTPLGQLIGAPYPPVFTQRTMLALDYFFLGLIAVGLAFLETAVVALRKSRYPRTDGGGAALVGTVLCALGGVVLFVRLWAVIHG